MRLCVLFPPGLSLLRPMVCIMYPSGLKTSSYCRQLYAFGFVNGSICIWQTAEFALFVLGRGSALGGDGVGMVQVLVSIYRH